MTDRSDAILFFARDFLADEFPKFHGVLDDKARVYIVSKSTEITRIAAVDPAGHIFNAAHYIDAAAGQDILRDQVFADMHQNVPRDRYLRRMAPEAIARVVHGVRTMLDEIGAQFRIRLYLDEPVSGFINECVNHWVRAQGGMPCHFQTTWLPGYMFFCRDATQAEPIVFDGVADAHEMIDAHFEKRLQNLAKPTYLLDYGSPLRALKDAAMFALKGLNRRLRTSEIFIDADPWPHEFQARCLWLSVISRYETPATLARRTGAKFLIFPLHYEPEAVITYFSDFTDQLDMVAAVFDNLPPDTYLLLKEHPSQPGAAHLPKWRQLMANQRVLAVKGTTPMHELLALPDSAVVTIASNAAIDAAINGRPAFIMGQPHFRDFPGVRFMDHRGPLDFTTPLPPASRAEIVAWYGDFIARHGRRMLFMRGRTDVPDPEGMFDRLLAQADADNAADAAARATG